MVKAASARTQKVDYLKDGYLADSSWVEYQVRRTVEYVAKHAGFDLSDPSLPFLIGFYVAPDYPEAYMHQGGVAPSVAIMEAYNWRKVRAQWEAAGHQWEGPDLTADPAKKTTDD